MHEDKSANNQRGYLTAQGKLLAEFWVAGVPAPYSTRRERPWKETIKRAVPRSNRFAHETGVELDFQLPGTDADSQVPDLDNLCEPAFSVLINKLGWFMGKRPNMWWWRASKRHTQETGCRIRLWSGAPTQIEWEPDQLVIDTAFMAPLSIRALEGKASSWARLQLDNRTLSLWRYRLLLHFGDPSLNLGEIATGLVKSTIDCLFPHPHDKWIINLQIEKGVAGVPRTGVKVILGRTRP